MIYNPLVLFAEKNRDKANSAFLLWHLIIALNISNKFIEVRMSESVFGGHDVSLLLRTEDK